MTSSFGFLWHFPLVHWRGNLVARIASDTRGIVANAAPRQRSSSSGTITCQTRSRTTGVSGIEATGSIDSNPACVVIWARGVVTTTAAGDDGDCSFIPSTGWQRLSAVAAMWGGMTSWGLPTGCEARIAARSTRAWATRRSSSSGPTDAMVLCICANFDTTMSASACGTAMLQTMPAPESQIGRRVVSCSVLTGRRRSLITTDSGKCALVCHQICKHPLRCHSALQSQSKLPVFSHFGKLSDKTTDFVHCRAGSCLVGMDSTLIPAAFVGALVLSTAPQGYHTLYSLSRMGFESYGEAACCSRDRLPIPRRLAIVPMAAVRHACGSHLLNTSFLIPLDHLRVLVG